jgi:hypothetical protein
MHDEKRVSRRWRTAALLTVGILIGVAVAASPAVGHYGSIKHFWNTHIKPRADARYVNANEPAANAVNAQTAANALGIADNTVNGAKVVDNSLAGADINESSLGSVPSASSAGNADTVDQIHATQFGFTGGALTGNTQALSFGGVVLTASCDLFGDLTLTATTTSNNALLRVSTNAGSAGASDFDTGASVDVLPGADDGVQGTFTYSRPFVNFFNPGATVTGTFTAEEDAFGADNCVVRGTALAYTPGIDIIIPPIVLP